MRPIVYEDLKVGDEVITRDGKEAWFMGEVKAPNSELVFAVRLSNGEDMVIQTDIKGNHIIPTESHKDIFLPPKKEYVNLYRSPEGMGCDYHGYGFPTKKEAEDFVVDKKLYPNFIDTIEVEL